MQPRNGGIYAELHCLSNFSFLRGASHPPELVTTAAELGYAGLAITDECSVAGIVRAHTAAKAAGFKLAVSAASSELVHRRAQSRRVAAVDRRSYATLCRLITRARRAAEKGAYRASREDLVECVADSRCALLWIPDEHYVDRSAAARPAAGYASDSNRSGSRRSCSMAAMTGAYSTNGEPPARLGIPLVAAGNVHMHCRERRMLQDTLTAIRPQAPDGQVRIRAASERRTLLAAARELDRKYPPELLQETLAILERIDFSLEGAALRISARARAGRQRRASYLRTLTERDATALAGGSPAKVARAHRARARS